jgi:hypothetical protein
VIGGFGPTNLTVADADGDGDPDVYAATQGSSATGDVTFLPDDGGTLGAATIVESSHQPNDVAIADFDGDGAPDMAVPNRGSGTGAIHPRGSGAAFEAPPTFPTFSAPDTVATADFNVDGALDVASTVPLAKVVDVKLNDGNGGLVQGATIASDQPYPSSVWAADLGGNTAPDLVWVASSFPTQFGYSLNNGDGTFSAATFVTVHTCGIGRVTTADVNGDGAQDVLVGAGEFGGCSAAADNGVSVSINDGTGQFAPDTFVALDRLPGMVLGADMNNDGILDLVGASRTANEGDVAVALGTGGGAFDTPLLQSTGAGHRELVVADFDDDGAPDVATTDGFYEMTSVLMNTGTGALAAPLDLPAEVVNGLLNEVAITAGDVNADGAIDIAVANRSGKDLGVYFGHGDGSFDTPQLRYGMHTDLTDIALADMNGDGQLDAIGPTDPDSFGGTAVAARTAAPAAAGPGVSVLLNGGEAVRTGSLTVGFTGTGHGVVKSKPLGVACSSVCRVTFARGEVVHLAARPARGSIFVGWSGACTGKDRCTVTIGRSTRVLAKFVTPSPHS